MMNSLRKVLRFWFETLSPADWWRKDTALDARIADEFGPLHAAAVRGDLAHWRHDPYGRLAEVLLLDQFSRNIFRERPAAFSQDAMALDLAHAALDCRAQRALSQPQRMFLYMPFMHSESRLVHLQAVALFHEPGLEHVLEFELAHKAIIDRFGRYPHRNRILGRVSTAQEMSFLAQPDSSF
ncbi:MAG: DUF924 domain-containing protein [Gammaproteobacteria bacterium]|nr:DUF924 domain-containing protein [Gammaproteobacteria bacterium]